MKILYCFIKRQRTSAARCIIMPTSLKIFTGKSIAIKISFAPETPFAFFIPINHYCNKFNASYTLWIIYEAFGIAGFHLESYQVRFWNNKQHSVVFVKNFHPVYQYMANKTHPVLQKIIKKLIMYMHVFKTPFFQIGNKIMYCRSCR